MALPSVTYFVANDNFERFPTIRISPVSNGTGGKNHADSRAAIQLLLCHRLSYEVPADASGSFADSGCGLWHGMAIFNPNQCGGRETHAGPPGRWRSDTNPDTPFPLPGNDDGRRSLACRRVLRVGVVRIELTTSGTQGRRATTALHPDFATVADQTCGLHQASAPILAGVHPYNMTALETGSAMVRIPPSRL